MSLCSCNLTIALQARNHTPLKALPNVRFLAIQSATAVLKSLPFDQAAEFTSHVTERISLPFSFTGNNTSLSRDHLLTLHSVSPRIVDMQITNARLSQRQRADKSSGNRQTLSLLRKVRKSE